MNKFTKEYWVDYRKKKLTELGFIPFESDFYSHFPMKQAGMRRVVRYRTREIRKAREAGIKQIPSYIETSYKAKGYVDDKGKPSAEIYNSTLFEELEKPVRERKTLFIQPDKYELYKHVAVSKKFTVQESREIAEAIPRDKLTERMQQYRILRSAYYSHSEALYIISAQTPEDKHGRTRLQKLNLTQDVWQTAMKERINWINSRIRAGKALGKTRVEVLRAIKREIENWYNKDKTRTPFDEIEEMYPQSRPPRVSVDFKDVMKNTRIARAKKQREEKAPWRVRR